MPRWHRAPQHRRIAPRLQSGESRVPSGNALPPLLKYCLRDIANVEGKSLSWVIETILIDWARHDPRLHRLLKTDALAYVPRKTDQAATADEVEAAVKETARAVARG